VTRILRLRRVVIRTLHSSTVGILYFQTDRHVVLLNNVVAEADLGRLKSRRSRHFEPEADVTVIPQEEVTSVEFLE
jgi:hypothetical protein